jgi:DNA topoisomerase I
MKRTAPLPVTDPAYVALADPEAAAKAARLRYVSDTLPGIRRMKTRNGFRYIGPDDKPVRDEKTLERIRSLGIPPAYTDVWICPIPNGHLQATGRDAKGRKQYRYHPRWCAVRDETKYDRMLAFSEALPGLRARVLEDLSRPGLPREKVLATAVRLLETTRIRVGNEEYARQNDSYGLTTLKNDHVAVQGTTVHFRFRGKSGKEHEIDVRDARVARILRRCQELPGQDLFEYVSPEDGAVRRITSEDVNEYLRETTGESFTAKDFRTWAGTMEAARALLACEPCDSGTAGKRAVSDVVKSVASLLGNTPAVCRKCYIHPAVLDAFLDGTLHGALTLPEMPPAATDNAATPVEEAALSAEEAALVRFLRGGQQESAGGGANKPVK